MKKPLQMLGTNNHKLRSYENKIEFLCLGCKNKVRITRSHKSLCLKKLKYTYLLTSNNNCTSCRKGIKKVYKIISENDAKDLINNGVELCK